MIEPYKSLSDNDCYYSQLLILEEILILIKNNHNNTKAINFKDNQYNNIYYVFDNQQVLYEINSLIHLIKINYSSLTYNLNIINNFLKKHNYKIIYNYTHNCYLLLKK
jgi:hypothetical protein